MADPLVTAHFSDMLEPDAGDREIHVGAARGMVNNQINLKFTAGSFIQDLACRVANWQRPEI